MDGRAAREISNGIVRRHSEDFGRGPAAAKTYTHDDLVVCVLHDVYTHVEQTLIEGGHSAAVRETRQLHYSELKRRIAALARLVEPAVAMGDEIAARILEHASAELGAAAASVIQRLDMGRAAFPTVLSGGMFHGIPSLVGALTARVHEHAPASDVRRLNVEPALGAVHLALAAARGELRLANYI